MSDSMRPHRRHPTRLRCPWNSPGKTHWSGLPLPSPRQESEKWKWSRSVVSDSLWPHELQPTRLLCPWDFPGKSTGVGCHCLLHIYYICICIYIYVYIYICMMLIKITHLSEFVIKILWVNPDKGFRTVPDIWQMLKKCWSLLLLWLLSMGIFTVFSFSADWPCLTLVTIGSLGHSLWK